MTQTQIDALNAALTAFLDQERTQAQFNEAASALQNAQSSYDVLQNELATATGVRDQVLEQSQAQFNDNEVFVIRKNNILFLVKTNTLGSIRMSIERVIVTDVF